MKKNKYKSTFALICLGVLIFYYWNVSSSKKIIIEYIVGTSQIKSIKQYKGVLKPTLTNWYNAEFNKEIVWRTETGLDVKIGDSVLKFQTSDLDDEIEGHEEGIVDIEASLAGMILQNNSETEKANLDTKEMAIKVSVEKFNYELAKNDPSKLIRDEQELLLKKDFLRKNFLESKYKTNAMLFAKGLVSETALQTSKVEFVRAESEYFKTSISAKDRLAGVLPIRLKRLEKQLELATLTYQDTLENEKNLKEIHRLNELKIKEDIFTIKNKIERFKRDIEKSTVKAPFDGKVFFPSIYKGSLSSEPIEIGETPIKGVGLLFFTNSSNYDVDFIVAESELNNISVGTSIDFVLKSNQTVKLKGEIYKLSEIATDKNILLGDLALERKGEANVRMIQVTAHLREGNADLRQGITGTVSLSKLGDKCISIPLNAVKFMNQKFFVETKAKELKEVTLGNNDGFLVEIKSGLILGEVILND